MTRQDLVNALGTIAQSGTAAFLQKHKTAQGDTSLIGQFGVGFYSVFLVADHVTVLSKHNDDKQHVWQSDSKGSFTVAEDPRGNTLGRGTKIVLHIKDDHKDFLSSETLEALVHKYSQFINFPIYLWKSHKETKEVPLTEEEIQKEKVGDFLHMCGGVSTCMLCLLCAISRTSARRKRTRRRRKTRTRRRSLWTTSPR